MPKFLASSLIFAMLLTTNYNSVQAEFNKNIAEPIFGNLCDPLHIDRFDTASVYASGEHSVSTDDLGVLGGNRELVTSYYSDSPLNLSRSNYDMVNVEIGLDMSSAFVSKNVTLIYDGLDNVVATDTIGLLAAPIDITGGGKRDTFRVNIEGDFLASVGQSSTITIRVYNGSDYAYMSKLATRADYGVVDLYFNINDFANNTTVIDYAKVTALTVNFDNAESLDSIVHSISFLCSKAPSVQPAATTTATSTATTTEVAPTTTATTTLATTTTASTSPTIVEPVVTQTVTTNNPASGGGGGSTGAGLFILPTVDNSPAPIVSGASIATNNISSADVSVVPTSATKPAPIVAGTSTKALPATGNSSNMLMLEAIAVILLTLYINKRYNLKSGLITA